MSKPPLIDELRQLSEKGQSANYTPKRDSYNFRRLKIKINLIELRASAKMGWKEDKGELHECVVEHLRANGLDVTATGKHGQFYPEYRVSWK